MKRSLLLLMLLSTTMLNAQDVIVKKDGTTILSKILEVTSLEVKYKKYSNQDGPTYSIPNSIVQVINFENGDREDFGRERYDSGVSVKKKNYKDWNRVYVQFDFNNFNYAVKNVDWDEPSSFNGLALGYSHGFNIVPNIPLYLEPGVAINYSFNTKMTPLSDDSSISKGYREFGNPWFLSIIVPVNFTYKLSFQNSNIAFAPYLGFHLRGNIVGFVEAKSTRKAEIAIASVTTASGWTLGDDNWFIFSKDDMGDKYAWNILQIGWQIGANVFIGDHFIAGASYGSDFSNIFKYPTVSAKISTFSISAGYVF